MNRRQTLGLLAFIPGASAAWAQTGAPSAGPALSGPEQTHASETLEAGFVARETSLVAAQKSTNAMVKRFAQDEAAEQETVAMVLKMRANLPDNAKPNITPESQSMIEKMNATKAGAEFDKAYVTAQIQGHQRLLKIQETYISAGKDTASKAIAMMARGHIKEHLTRLEMLRKDLAA